MFIELSKHFKSTREDAVSTNETYSVNADRIDIILKSINSNGKEVTRIFINGEWISVDQSYNDIKQAMERNGRRIVKAS